MARTNSAICYINTLNNIFIPSKLIMPSSFVSASLNMPSMTSIGKSCPKSSSATIDVISSRVMYPSPSCVCECVCVCELVYLVEYLKARFQIVLLESSCWWIGHVLHEFVQRDHSVLCVFIVVFVCVCVCVCDILSLST
jgi:hypothetical protein